jgi:adenylate cyclase class 2
MREIEIKARVIDAKAFEEKLLEAGIKLSEPTKQHDRVYGEPNIGDNHPGANWLRIRTENDATHIFTLKSSVKGHLDSIEHETRIEDPMELENIILALHFVPYSDLTKIRRKAKVGDIEICFDTVPGLGTFVEAEKMMGHDADHDTVVAELWDLLRGLDISEDQEVHEGYDVLERRTRGL